MHERARAQELLRQARDILVQRLSEQVLDSAEEILNDARGDSYMNEIETLYEQIGLKLSHVSQMLANLPASQEPFVATTANATDHHAREETYTTAAEATGHVDAQAAAEMPALMGPVIVSAPALPGPHLSIDTEGPASFVLFVTQLRDGDEEAAGKTLSRLFEIDGAMGLRCARFFAERMERDVSFLNRAMQLRGELQSQGHNGALMLLYECFGLTGMESVAVLQTLRRRIAQQA